MNLRGLGRLWDELTSFPEVWGSRPLWVTLGGSALDTLAVAFAATALCAVAAVPLAIAASSTWSPRWLVAGVRSLLLLLRSVPLILLALLAVISCGLGSQAGLLAMTVHATGVLGKMLADEIEAADPWQLRAVAATGATRLQIMRWGLWPQIRPQVISLWFLRLEMNVREATILGLVGAGGIGLDITRYAASVGYHRAKLLPACVVVIAMVAITEVASSALRRRLL